MTDFEAPAERLVEHLNPLADLREGESLVAAGRYDEARELYTDGLANVEAQHLTGVSTEYPPKIVAAALHYSRAEAWRLKTMQLANMHRRPAARQCQIMQALTYARTDLYTLDDYSQRTLVLEEPASPRTVQANALTYLATRCQGFLSLGELVLIRPQDSHLAFSRALSNLMKAETALVAGVLQNEESLTIPRLPPDPSDIAAYDLYLVELTNAKMQRRRARRQADPALHQAVAATEGALNPREHQPHKYLVDALPDLCAPGPLASKLLFAA